MVFVKQSKQNFLLAVTSKTHLAFLAGVLGLSDDFPSVMISITFVLPLELSDENLDIAEVIAFPRYVPPLL